VEALSETEKIVCTSRVIQRTRQLSTKTNTVFVIWKRRSCRYMKWVSSFMVQ